MLACSLAHAGLASHEEPFWFVVGLSPTPRSVRRSVFVARASCAGISSRSHLNYDL